MSPASAILYERLAEKQENSGLDPVPALMRAAELAPANAEPHLRLGLRAELAGDFVLAERSLLQAAERSRLYQPRYSLSQFYFRRKNDDEFFRWTRAALETSYGDVRPLLVLAWNVRPDPLYFVNLAKGQRPRLEGQFLSFLLQQKETAAAGSVAAHLAANGGGDDLEELLAYCDRMLEGADPIRALEVWNTLCRRHVLPFEVLGAPGPLLTNHGFQQNPSGRGFDWRIEPVAGVETRFSKGQWRTSLSGLQPEHCVIGWQYVPLEPGKKYHVKAEYTGPDNDLITGLSWTIFDGPAPKVALIYKRPPGSVRIQGTVITRNLRLEPGE